MKVSEILSQIDRETLARLLEKSDSKAFRVLSFNYLLIGLCFLAIVYFPNLLVWLLSAAVLAGRQLGLAILMHDCAHQAFFKSPGLNKVFGQWFCAAPVLADLNRYRPYHLEHHRAAGSEQDPDRTNYVNYPVKRNSMRRKFLRDFSGITGFKIFLTIVKMNAGLVAYQLAYDETKKQNVLPVGLQLKNIILGVYPSLIFHSLLLTFFVTIGEPQAYLLWWLAWGTFYMVFSRLRNASEHGATASKDDLNPLLNTRTTRARFYERLLVAPNNVNYHLEHHLLPSIPAYNLREFHEILSEKGVLKDAMISQGYFEVLRDLTAHKA